MVWDRKISLVVFGLCVFAILAALFVGGPQANWFVGTSAATVLDPRFIIILLLLLTLLHTVNILVLAAIGSLLLTTYFHLTLQEYWRELGIEREFVTDLLKPMFPFTFLLSAAHAYFGKRKESS
jgi:hypothetical protein